MIQKTADIKSEVYPSHTQILRGKYLTNKRVGITGATGHLGSVFTDHALSKAKHTMIMLFDEEYSRCRHFELKHYHKLTMLKGRLPNKTLQRRMIEDNDIIVHAAALVTGANSKTKYSLAEYLLNNSLPMALFINEIDQSAPQPKIIFPSSIRVYELTKPAMDDEDRTVFCESDLVFEDQLNIWIEHITEFLMAFTELEDDRKTISRIGRFLKDHPVPDKYAFVDKYYPLSKAVSERIIRRYNRGLTLRLAAVYGPGYNAPGHVMHDRLVHRYLYCAREGADIFYTSVHKNCIFVEDVVQAFLAAAELPLEAFEEHERVLNIGADRLYTGEQIGQMIIDISEGTSELVLDSLTNELPRKLFDFSRRKKYLNVDPENLTSLDEGLKKTWEWLINDETHKSTWSNRFFCKSESVYG